MMIKRAILITQGLALMAIGAQANAQADLTCADVEYGYELTSKFPDIADACMDVVEQNGENFVKTTVELVSTGNNRYSRRRPQ